MSITIKLTDKEEKRLDELSKLTGHSKSYYIHQAVREKLDDLEDLYTAEYRLENPADKHWSLDELERGNDVES